jgi:two-component system sensor kinase FixL
MVAMDGMLEIKPALPSSRRRVAAYLILGVGLTIAFAAARGIPWQGNAALHTTMESVATLLAAIVGAIALLRYYARRESNILYVGAGFLGTAFLDGYHTLVTSAFFKPMMPSDLPSLIPWSWVASRQFLAIFLVLSCLAWVYERRHRSHVLITPAFVYLLTAILAVASFLFFAIAPLPRAYYPEFIFHRPEEFGPALFFFLALAGYLYKGGWRRDSVDHWLVITLIISLTGQAVFMPVLGALFDFEFDAAHMLKKISYFCALTGFLASMYQVLKNSDSLNSRLRQEVLERQREQVILLRVQADLWDSEEKARTTLETMADGVVTINSKGIVKSFNPAAETLFGYAGAEIRGRNVDVLLPGAFGRHLDVSTKKYLKIRKELVGKRKDESKFDIELSLSKMNIGTQSMFTGVIRDISRRKRDEAELKKYAESLRQSNFELEQFASVASHDLQEPLRKVQAFGDRLRRKYAQELDDQGRDYIARMLKSTARMQTLIDSLLSFSRISSKGKPYQPVNLNEIARGVTDDLEIVIRENNVALTIEDLPVIDADPVQMRQLFQNLIGNAIKYRRADIDPIVHVSAHIDPLQSGLAGENASLICHLTVSDNGIGFDNSYAEKIFAIFQRLHGRSEFDGTGIGLAICRKIVERHGGSIEASGKADQGARFVASLPVSHALEEVG